MVILEDNSNHKTVFLKEGEKYISLRIKKINKSKVQLIDKRVQRVINLEK